MKKHQPPRRHRRCRVSCSHLADLLLARATRSSHDNFVTGSVDNISHLAGNPDFKSSSRTSPIPLSERDGGLRLALRFTRQPI